MPKSPPKESERSSVFRTVGRRDAAYTASFPKRLPPDPALVLDGELLRLFGRASAAVGRLDGATARLQNPKPFLWTYMRKEAVLSSQIEGTQSSLTDLLLHENEQAPGVPQDDVEEVSNYVRAMATGVELMRTKLPLSLRLLRDVHRELARGTRGSDKTPGEFRTSKNWIGESRPGNAAYVPPPADQLADILGNLETFLHGETQPPLIKAGLAHAQFETIHPFLDGNGRLGRMLITMLLLHDGVLQEPMLYMSLHFKRHRTEGQRLGSRAFRQGQTRGARYAAAWSPTCVKTLRKSERLYGLAT